MDILLVDDDLVDRQLVKRTLNKCHLKFNITEALSVNQALIECENHKFDLILLDYRLPERDGIDLVFEMRNKRNIQNTAIIVMSSSEDEDLALECIRAGAQDFLSKSEITEKRLRQAMLHAAARFELEEKLKQTFEKVKMIAETDNLTGLANRYMFDQIFLHDIITHERGNGKLALLLFDIDHFKNINDTYGHDIGDLVLKRVVRRIKSCLRGNELFSRLGGDEFAILITQIKYPDSASLVANRILKVLEPPLHISNITIKASVSIGVAIYPKDGINKDELFKYADIAMYKSKSLGRNQVSFFEPLMKENANFRLSIENELKIALHENQFELYYQPIVNPHNKQLKGFEALLRWHHKDQLKSPDDFLGIAEEVHQIHDIEKWVIENAIKTISQWNKGRDIPFTMTINISAHQLMNPEIIKLLAKELKKNQVPAHLIIIEFKEDIFTRDKMSINAVIEKMKALGVRLSLDDFGSGYTSVLHLLSFPFDVIKIDKSFINTDNDPRKSAFFEGMTYMAKSLGFDMVAEGVDSVLSAQLCQHFHLSHAQGYFYSKPLSAAAIQERYLIHEP